MATDKDRVTLYIDAGIHRDMKAFVKEQGTTLSAFTRFVYMFMLGVSQLDKLLQYQLDGLATRYPNGVPEEERGGIQKEFSDMRERMFERWFGQLRGYMVGAGGLGAPLDESGREAMWQLFNWFWASAATSYTPKPREPSGRRAA